MLLWPMGVQERVVLITLLLALQAAWIVSVVAFFHTTPIIHLQEPHFGHVRQRQSQPTHRRGLAASSTNNDAFFDMEELRQRIRMERLRPMLPPSVLSGHSPWRPPTSTSSKPQLPLDHVYIVSFPETTSKKKDISSSPSLHLQSGGIHSIECPSGKNVILAFTNQESCDHFVQHLRRQEFFDPVVGWFYQVLHTVRRRILTFHLISVYSSLIFFVMINSNNI